MNRTNIYCYALLLIFLFAPVAGVTYGCVHYYMLMRRMNHVQDRGSQEDLYEWLFSGLFVLTVLFIIAYILAWVKWFQWWTLKSEEDNPSHDTREFSRENVDIQRAPLMTASEVQL